MSFISVDFDGARLMANEIETMSRDCAAMAGETGLEELKELAADLAGIVADVRRACDEREQQENDILLELRPNYQEVLK